jgi:hypothetical protein
MKSAGETEAYGRFKMTEFEELCRTNSLIRLLINHFHNSVKRKKDYFSEPKK